MEENGNVKVRVELLIKERKIRIWSQQHLADVAGVSLRTIQRIEKTSIASADSVKAISSAFEKQPNYFIAVDKTPIKKQNLIRVALAFCALSLLIFTSIYFNQIAPDKVKLKVNYKGELLKSADINESEWLIELDLNSELNIKLANDLELTILPFNGRDDELLIETTLKYQSGKALIPNSLPAPLTHKLDGGVLLSYEKDSEINVVINITEIVAD